MFDDSAPGCSSAHHFSNARNIHFHGPATFNTAGGNIGRLARHSVAELQARLGPIFDATHSRDRKVCTRGTSKGALRSITVWANSEIGPRNHLFILTGCVGSGKTTISETISQYYRPTRLGGSWFFSKQSGERRKMGDCVATLASQLVAIVPSMAPHIKVALTSHRDLLQVDYTRYDPTSTPHDTTSLSDQLLSRLLTPFRMACERGEVPKERLPLIIVVDGLDECGESSQVEVFLKTILDFFRDNPTLPLRFFLATRIVPHIDRTYSKEEVVQHGLDSHGSEEDMAVFFREAFSWEVLNRHRVIQAFVQQHGSWPEPWYLRRLAEQTKGSFLLASRMVNYILDSTDDDLTPMERLSRALEMELNLDELYMQTFSRHRNLPHFFEIVSAITLLVTPLSISALAEFLDISRYEVVHVLQGMQAVIELPPNDSNLAVNFCHESLRVFFKTKARSKEFYVPPSHHLMLAYRCFLRNVHRGPLSNPLGWTTANTYSVANCIVHWDSFLQECGEEDIIEEIESFSNGPCLEGVSRHAFLSTLFIWQLFHVGSGILEPRQLHVAMPPSILSHIFTDWARHLVLAVEEGPDPFIISWLDQPIGHLIRCTPFWGTRAFSLSRDGFQTFQANIQAALTAAKIKVG
ncbi:hypothetical protein MD484_g3241, partial [Candolleomyces efflorescens]